MLKKYFPLITVLCVIALTATAGSIKTWASGETLRGADLNAALAHIHNLMVGGHGARLVDADVSATAAIQLSKISVTAALIPKAWVSFNTLCGAGSCNETIAASSGVTTVAHTGVGLWTVTWDTARADGNYATLVTGKSGQEALCTTRSPTTTTIGVSCIDRSAGTALDKTWGLLMMDNL